MRLNRLDSPNERIPSSGFTGNLHMAQQVGRSQDSDAQQVGHTLQRMGRDNKNTKRTKVGLQVPMIKLAVRKACSCVRNLKIRLLCTLDKLHEYFLRFLQQLFTLLFAHAVSKKITRQHTLPTSRALSHPPLSRARGLRSLARSLNGLLTHARFSRKRLC